MTDSRLIQTVARTGLTVCLFEITFYKMHGNRNVLASHPSTDYNTCCLTMKERNATKPVGPAKASFTAILDLTFSLIHHFETVPN